MSSLPNLPPARRPRPASGGDSDRVLRGDQAAAITAAQLDGDLRGGKSRIALNDEALEEARRAAAAQGYADGWAEGQRAATAAVRAEAERAAAEQADLMRQFAEALARGLSALAQAADELERRMAQPMADAQAELASAALALAEAMLGHEIDLAVDPTYDAIHRALDLTPASRPVLIRLHPSEAAAVQHLLEDDEADLMSGRPFTVVGDPSVAPAGAVVECDATRIDAQLPPALARVREVLNS